MQIKHFTLCAHYGIIIIEIEIIIYSEVIEMKTAKEILCDALARKQITVDEFKKAIARLEAMK